MQQQENQWVYRTSLITSDYTAQDKTLPAAELVGNERYHVKMPCYQTV